MIKDNLTGKVVRWSLKRVQFLLSHIEDFIDDESEELRDRARQFSAQTDLDKIERLVEADPNDPELPRRLIERLSAFFEAGILLQRGCSPEDENWWVTDLFWRGNIFHLDLNDQVRANALIPDMTPLQVNRTPAKSILEAVGLEFLAAAEDTQAYLLKPTPVLALLLLSDLPAPWAVDHIIHAHRLINRSFIF
jgi:hypothetical protein